MLDEYAEHGDKPPVAAAALLVFHPPNCYVTKNRRLILLTHGFLL